MTVKNSIGSVFQNSLHRLPTLLQQQSQGVEPTNNVGGFFVHVATNAETYQ